MTPKAPTATGYICDTIRFEADGKLSLIGIHTGTTLFPNLPTQVSFALFFQATPIPDAGTRLTLRLIQDEDELFSFGTEVPDPPNDSNDAQVTFAIDRIFLTLNNPGTLKYTAQLGDDAPMQLATIKIAKMAEE